MTTHAAGGLSVTKVAEIVGLTPRAVRYYHSIGLVPEPPRDSSGYRRYGGKEVVELVRVARLRALGMPLPQIAQRVSAAEAEDVSLADALGSLADELDAEIARIVATRDRLRELARSETFDQPVKTLTQALQDQGVLGPADHLRASEQWAAAVLDAVHPDGMTGVLAEASRLFEVGCQLIVAPALAARRTMSGVVWMKCPKMKSGPRAPASLYQANLACCSATRSGLSRKWAWFIRP